MVSLLLVREHRPALNVSTISTPPHHTSTTLQLAAAAAHAPPRSDPLSYGPATLHANHYSPPSLTPTPTLHAPVTPLALAPGPGHWTPPGSSGLSPTAAITPANYAFALAQAQAAQTPSQVPVPDLVSYQLAMAHQVHAHAHPAYDLYTAALTAGMAPTPLMPAHAPQYTYPGPAPFMGGHGGRYGM